MLFLPRFSGPVQRTLTDFWRLVWQEEVPMIVMVTNLTEGNTKKCTQYWPEPGCYKYGPFSVSLIEKMVFADFIIRNFRVTGTIIMRLLIRNNDSALWYTSKSKPVTLCMPTLSLPDSVVSGRE